MKSTETFIEGWDDISSEGWDLVSKDVDYAGWPCNRIDLNPISI